MKKYIAGIAPGVILSCTVALAVNYTATENTFPIQLNGENVNVCLLYTSPSPRDIS